MNRDRLMWNLENWKDWHKIGEIRESVKCSSIYPSSGIRSTDDLAENVDDWAAEEMEVVINDMGERVPLYRDAIHVQWLGASGLIKEECDMDYTLECAYMMIRVMADSRGVV